MKIAAIERTPVGLTFHKEPTRDGLYLYWDNADKKFYTGVNGSMRPVANEKYARAKDEKEARKVAKAFFDDLGEE